MIIVALTLILAGSFTGAVVLWMQDGSLWQIVFAYIAGGYAGLIAGIPIMLLMGHWNAQAARPGKRTGKRGKKMQLRPAVAKRHENGR